MVSVHRRHFLAVKIVSLLLYHCTKAQLWLFHPCCPALTRILAEPESENSPRHVTELSSSADFGPWEAQNPEWASGGRGQLKLQLSPRFLVPIH